MSDKSFPHYGKIRTPTGIAGLRVTEEKESETFGPAPNPSNITDAQRIETRENAVVVPFVEPAPITEVLEKLTDRATIPPTAPNESIVPFRTDLDRTIPETQ